MSAELIDLRAKVTPRINAALEAKHRATGRDKSEIVREVLGVWADSFVHEASLLHGLLVAEGEPGIAGGSKGKIRESQG